MRALFFLYTSALPPIYRGLSNYSRDQDVWVMYSIHHPRNNTIEYPCKKKKEKKRAKKARKRERGFPLIFCHYSRFFSYFARPNSHFNPPPTQHTYIQYSPLSLPGLQSPHVVCRVASQHQEQQQQQSPSQARGRERTRRRRSSPLLLRCRRRRPPRARAPCRA